MYLFLRHFDILSFSVHNVNKQLLLNPVFIYIYKVFLCPRILECLNFHIYEFFLVKFALFYPTKSYYTTKKKYVKEIICKKDLASTAKSFLHIRFL